MSPPELAVEEPRRPGRPRDASVEQAILDATLSIIQEGGFGACNVEAVASRAGVGKATIYRRWPSRGELLLAALGTIADDIDQPDTGSLRGDLEALYLAVASHMQESRLRAVLPALLAEADTDPRLRDLVEGFIDGRRDLVRTILGQARRRGELRRNIDEELLLDMLAGPIFYRLLISGAPVEAEHARQVAEMLLRGIAATA